MRGRRIKASDQSYGQLQAKLLVALQSARGSSCYINDVWDDHVVFTQWSDLSPSTTWSVPYAITDGTVTFGDVTKVEPVTSYVAIKRVGPDTVEGLAIPFGGIFAGKDFDGEDFGSDTDFCLDWFGTSGRPVLYDHGLDRSVKSAVAGRPIEHEVREEGIWAQAQLDRATKVRLTVEAGPWVGARKSWHAKSGRVLSAATRDRLAAHPSALRQLADDLDALLADADAPKDTGKRASAWELELEAERARAFGVPI
jgi:hypothetical protein